MNMLCRFMGTLIALFMFVVVTMSNGFAATSSQVVSSQTQQDIITQNNRTIEEKISVTQAPEEEESSKDSAEEVKAAAKAPNTKEQKFLVKQIDVQGATIPTNTELYEVTVPYQDTEMSLADAQKVADLITDIYRKKGFVTSRAYLPPQTMKNNVLVIKVVEGKLGSMSIKGNRYFGTSLLKRKMHVADTGYFDYSALQRSLVYINQHPDRVAKTILMPGKEPGTTDVVVNVEDRMPIHAGFTYDNYGSRYIDRNRYALTLEHNNLLGFDDRLFLKVQTSEANYMRFAQAQYVFPVSETLNVGAYGVYSDLVLGKEFAALEAEGRARVVGIFADKALIQDPGFEWRINGGLDYKNIYNYELGTLVSRDKVRVAKLGTGLDITDKLGRTIINPELNVGLPKVLDGMESKDGMASRAGSGGSFQKETINIYRLQPLPFETSLLWKNSAQWSHHNLPASEQFQIGGPTSVRGYAPAEFGGDKGLYSAWEWSIPPYFIPDSAKVPFTQESLKDSFRLVSFYDLGFVHLNNTSVGEKENQTLRGWGYGVRLNVRDNLICRLELGYPLGREPADGNNMHPWIEITARY